MDTKEASNLSKTSIDADKSQKNAECCLLKNSCHYVSEHPIKSLGIAALSGFLLSRVLSGR